MGTQLANTHWVCTCGALYRLQELPGAGRKWEHIGQNNPQPTPNPSVHYTVAETISKAELDRYLTNYLRAHGEAVEPASSLVNSLRGEFNLPIPPEGIEVTLRLKIPGVSPELTQFSLAERAGEYLATLPAEALVHAMLSVSRVRREHDGQ
jgi:hypothetical protein